jgi:tetratricopeptide (TPR) repeat protein
MDKAQKILDAAILAEEEGQYSKALRLYERSSTVNNNPASRLRWASLLYDQGRWKEAISVARQVTRRWPAIYLAHSLIGRCYVKVGHLLKAERAFRQSLVAKPKPSTWVFLSDVLSRLGRENESIGCLRSALALDPEYEEAHYNLGCIYKLRGKQALAERHLRRAIEIDPKYALAYAELGDVLLRFENRVKEAVTLLQKSIRLNPDYGWSRGYLAIALWKRRRLKAADEQYRRFIEIWPDDYLPYCFYGDFLAYEGKDRLVAERYLRKAIEMDPQSELTNYHLGKHLCYWGKKEEGVRLLRKAARLGHPRAHEQLAAIEEDR